VEVESERQISWSIQEKAASGKTKRQELWKNVTFGIRYLRDDELFVE